MHQLTLTGVDHIWYQTINTYASQHFQFLKCC